MPEDFKAEELIFLLRKINLHLSTQLELSLKEKDISGIQAYFMVYILRHHPKGTYLTELCQEILQKANQMEDRICNVLTQQEKAQLQILAKKFLVRLVELEQEQGQTKSDRRYFKREKSFTTAQAV